MYLSRFGVRNYKCLGDIDIPLTPIHVLIGQNDCGKTSLLEAMEAFFATSDKAVSDIFPRPWMGRDLVRHANAEPQIDLSGCWERHPSEDVREHFRCLRYSISLRFAAAESACSVTDEQTIVDDSVQTQTPTAGHLTSVFSWKRDPKSRTPRQSDGCEALMAVAEVLVPAQKYALNAKQMALPAAFDSDRKFRLDSDGFGLATLLDDIVSFDPSVFLDMREEFCRLFPQFRSVRVMTEYGAKRYVESNGQIRWAGGQDGKGIRFEMRSGETIDARHTSDGAILFLGLLALVHSPQQPGVLLLEEPENGVYPLRLGQIITILKEMVKRTKPLRFPQIILTTHSPYVLSFFEPEEVTLLSRVSDEPDAPVRARPLRDAPNIRERLGNDFYLGELWYNLSEGELFGDAPCQSCH